VELVDLPPPAAATAPFTKQPKRRKIDYTTDNIDRGPNPRQGYKVS
jgi:hypothetical protein